MRLFKRAREEGLSLRMTNTFMLVISIGISMALLATGYRTIRSFHALSRATDSYIELEDAANSLISASDYLTEEARSYTVLGDRKHLDYYLSESEQIQRREQAVAVLERNLPETEALDEIKGAMEESQSLMGREYYAIRLVMDAVGDRNVPAVMQDVRLTEEDQRLSAEEKKALAERMLHDKEYYTQKDRIRSHMTRCVNELKSSTRATQEEMERQMHTELVYMVALVVIQSVGVAVMLWLTTKLGINPLLRAVDHIKQDQSLPIMGANEFRYLAATYNRMYIAYKHSIENLSFKASHDELTGVYNRAGYDLILQSMDLSTTAFLLFDADRFKRVNDGRGHDVGDGVLKKIAATLRRSFRADDYVCRIGGDEFVVLMVHVDDNIRPLIEKKVAQINAELEDGSDGLPPISISTGVSLCNTRGNAHEMFREADIALYRVKDRGGRGCCFYDADTGDRRQTDGK